MDPWQREDFEAIDPAWQRMVGIVVDRPTKSRAYLERPRGHSKTTDLAAMALWAIFAAPRMIVGVAGAASKPQAGLLREGIEKIVRLNPWLAEEIGVHKWTVWNRQTGSQFEILAANEQTTYGKTPDFVIADELTHWPKEGFWTSLFSAVAKRANCVCVVIANAGFGQGISWHWQARERCRLNERWHFHSLPGPIASWITAENLAEQRELLVPLAYKRLWGNKWIAAVGDALNIDALYKACVLPGPVLFNPLDYSIAGLDLGLARDHSGVVFFGLDHANRCLRLLETRRFDPRDPSVTIDGRISFNAVETYMIDACNRQKCQLVVYDPWQCEHLAENLRLRGIICVPFYPTIINKKRMALDLMEATNHFEVDLYRDESLLTDLARMNIVSTPQGYKVDAPADENGHCDVGTAYALGLPFALDALAEVSGRRGVGQQDPAMPAESVFPESQ